MTAIEWLLENLISEPLAETDFEHNKECWNKAEEMEKKQIFETTNSGRILFLQNPVLENLKNTNK